MAWQLWDYGPVVAVSEPGTSSPPMGAAREELPGSTWQQRIEQWMTEARLIAVMVGRTQGLAWELQRLTQLRLWHKTVLVLPPVETAEARQRWASVRDCSAEPDYRRGCGRSTPIVRWHSPSRPRAKRSRRSQQCGTSGPTRSRWGWSRASWSRPPTWCRVPSRPAGTGSAIRSPRPLGGHGPRRPWDGSPIPTGATSFDTGTVRGGPNTFPTAEPRRWTKDERTAVLRPAVRQPEVHRRGRQGRR